MISYTPLVRTLRKKKIDIGLLQRELGKKDGSLRSSLNSGRYISLKVIDDICRILECKVDEVICWESGEQVVRKVNKYAECDWGKLIKELGDRGESLGSASEKLKHCKGWLQSMKNRRSITKSVLKEVCDKFFIDYKSVISGGSL